MAGGVNPIIPGFAPDPSVTRIGDVFFLVNSTFHLFPGLPIYASQDLKTWTQIGNAINRQSQLSLRFSDTKLHPQTDGSTMLATGGLFAPTIRYHEASKTVYVICTNIVHPEDGGEDIPENFIVSTKDIFSDVWSDPVRFDFSGIDPSLFWDEDDGDKVYFCGSRGPGPMTTISLFEINLATGQKLTTERTIWKGTGGIYPEGPHIYKRDGWYYLLISEGGTWVDHCITIARAREIHGPYESCPSNPILTARGKPNEYVQATGHCDVFEDIAGNWWGVCLGIRMKGESCIMGRESFLVNASWEQGEWPTLEQVVIDPAKRESATSGRNSVVKTKRIEARPNADFVFLRDANLDDHVLADNGDLVLVADSGDLSQWDTRTTFIGKRQRELDGQSSVVLCLPHDQSDIKAGFAIYKDEHRFARIFWNGEQQCCEFEILNRAKNIQRTAQSERISGGQEIRFKIKYSEDRMEFAYQLGVEGKVESSRVVLGSIDTAELSGSDFVGPIHGIYAVAKEREKVVFKGFTV